MRIIKSIIVAFSMYSRIPMPGFKWESDDMKYHFIFFPWIGGVILALEYALRIFVKHYNIPTIVFTFLAVVIPLIITGGFHLDGYLDTVDALSSYQSKEKRLEILKDPHIGAFSIIGLVIYGLLLISSIYVMDDKAFLAWSIMFFESRAISGICGIKYKKAKEHGLLNTEANTASEKTVVFILALEFLVVAFLAGIYLQYVWTVALISLLLAVIYYFYMSHAKFGGVTGDLAGWFVCMAELMCAIAVALYSVIV